MKKLSLILAVLAAAFIFAACAKPNKAESVNLEPEPAKKAYLYGEELDLGGGALNIVYTKGNVRTLEITPAMVTGYDKYAPGEQTLTVKASEKFKCTYTVTVAAPDSSYVVPTGITAVYGQTLKDIAAQLPQYFSWVTPSAPVGNAGSNTVYANYKPTAPGTEATANIAVVITVSKADPAITQAPSVPGSVFTYGDIPVLSGGVASVPGAFAWKNPNPVLFAGANDLEWVFTPADAANYNTVERSLNLTAGKAAPTVTDGNKPSADGAQFTYGQAMPAIKQGKALGLLGGEISGAFSWVNPPLTLAVNENIINWIFTPSGVDAANYTSASGAVTVTAGKAAPNIVTEPTVTPGAYTYGQRFPTVADGAAKGLDGNTLTGRFEYNGNGGTLLTGDNEIGWTFVPNDTANYGTASGTV
ncbi:MAG: bacterial Ig-like domain-containing protein, partial [Clostridiales bacterium]|nr:bacterial Ig-like domain-containing protein [Clostridiales bacterium]